MKRQLASLLSNEGTGEAGPSDVASEADPHVMPVVTTVIAAGVLAFSVRLTWLHTGLGGDVRQYPGTRLAVISITVLAGAATIVGAALIDGFMRRRSRLVIAFTVSCVMAAGTGVLLLLVESAAGLIPRSLIPATMRRLTVDLGAGPGLWLAFGSSLCASLAATAPPWWRLRLRLPVFGRGDRSSTITTAAVLTLIGATVAFGWARYEPWVNASAGAEDFSLEGWATPWIGPLSLLALWCLVAGVAVLVLARVDLAALLAAGAGWLCSFLSALAILTSGALGRVRIGDRLPEGVQHLAPAVGSARGAWWAFLAGLVAAGAAAILLAVRPGEALDREDEWTPY